MPIYETPKPPPLYAPKRRRPNRKDRSDEDDPMRRPTDPYRRPKKPPPWDDPEPNEGN
jgi:hypothetical protein